jgi:hypothetical protein
MLRADLRKLVALPTASELWRWQLQLQLQHHFIDAGAFTDTELAAREGLPALWFRLESAADTGAVVAVADALLAWLGRHPGFDGLRTVFAELLGAMVAPLSLGIRVSRDLVEMRSRLVARAEQWVEQWKEEGLQAGQRKGGATLLLRLMQRRFGPLPDWATDRVLAADIPILEESGLRIFDAARLEDVVGEQEKAGTSIEAVMAAVGCEAPHHG